MNGYVVVADISYAVLVNARVCHTFIHAPLPDRAEVERLSVELWARLPKLMDCKFRVKP